MSERRQRRRDDDAALHRAAEEAARELHLPAPSSLPKSRLWFMHNPPCASDPTPEDEK